MRNAWFCLGTHRVPIFPGVHTLVLKERRKSVSTQPLGLMRQPRYQNLGKCHIDNQTDTGGECTTHKHDVSELKQVDNHHVSYHSGCWDTSEKLFGTFVYRRACDCTSCDFKEQIKFIFFSQNNMGEYM
jgi:hypothetical protein